MKPTLNSLSRVMNTIMTRPQPPAEISAPGGDAAILARELSREFIERLREYRKARNGDMSLFEIQDMQWENFLEAFRTKSPDQVTFDDLERLSRDHPEEALARWEEVRATAREDIGNGWHAARGVAHSAWDRACYLAVRDQLRETFPPRSGVESMLLDEMAQYEMLRRSLVAQLPGRGWHSDKDRGPEYRVPAAIIQTLDRLQRLFQYALRTLLALQRARQAVVVRSPGPPRLGGGPPPDAHTDAPDGENAR